MKMLRQEAETLRSGIKRLSVDIAGAARGSPLIAEVDFHDLRHNTRRALASIHFNEYRYSGIYIHHDEGSFVGADPPSQEEVPVSVEEASQSFAKAVNEIRDLIELLSPSETTQTAAAGTATYRPNTAFVMMAIDKKKPEFLREVFVERCRFCIDPFPPVRRSS
jgi:hypothetical protein